MNKFLIAGALALSLATPAQANSDDAGALIFGIITGMILNEAGRNDQPAQTHHHYHYPDQRHLDQDWNRRCGWYEQAERVGNRIYYYRINGCNHRIIGERWEYAPLRY